METAFMPIFAQVPQPSEDEMLDLLKPAQQIYASKGVTTAQEGATHAEELEFLRKAGATGRLYIDCLVTLRRGSSKDIPKLSEHRQQRQEDRRARRSVR
jgi:predicted amidohydrolase YtcJ